MIPEKEREALLRLIMCARHQCAVCKYRYLDYDCGCIQTECMNVLADALNEDGDNK